LKLTSPKITIVTPVLNGEKYIEKTILSVINQDYKNIEYIIVDGQSTDNTISIVKKYKKNIKIFISEKDKGMYDALLKGFKLGTGKYFAWINSDDYYLTGAIKKAINFMEVNKLQWIVGRSNVLSRKNKIYSNLYHYPKFIIKNKLAAPCTWGYIPQESTIFTKKLYFKSTGIDSKFKYAGDFDLWVKFSKYSNLFSTNINIAVFRKRIGQLSLQNKSYLNEINKINCLFPFGKILRYIYSKIITLKKINEI
jgi:glycosyltransferase involved in cell wall biosynthesis